MKRIWGPVTLGVPILMAGFASAATVEKIDLDGVAPSEIVISDDGVQTVNYWSPQNGMWLELLRTDAKIEGVADDPQSALRLIKSDGRYWQWRNDAYVPLVAQEAASAGDLADDVFAQAVEFIGDFDEVPPNTPANIKIDITIDGRPSMAALLGGGVFCSMGGTNCPVVVFHDGSPKSKVYVNLSQAWGFSPQVNEHGYPYVESQLERAVLLIDSETGAETELAGISPKASEPQPQTPKDLP